MIARIWRGRIPAEKLEEYRAYVASTGLRDYETTPGNLGSFILDRRDAEHAEIVTLTFWESYDAIRAFAGNDPERARYYPEDGRFLLDFPETVEHYDVTRR